MAGLIAASSVLAFIILIIGRRMIPATAESESAETNVMIH
jgi:hypothetical protein